MVDRAMFALTFAAAIGSAVVGGIFYAFSSFVMAALGRLPAAEGAAAMNAINVTVINFSFMTVFMGTALICLVLAGGSWFWWGETRGKLILVASLIYLIGSIGVTMVGNVPLNDALAAIQPNVPEAAAIWSQYLGVWTGWNHVRTIASLVAAVLFMAALI